jgi:anaerobic selenocysteine-containing dehydrogenase
MVDRNAFPLHAVTQRPAAMYHSWGSMNAWLRQIHTRNVLYVPGAVCDELGLADGDWVHVVSHHGRIKVEVARSEAVNAQTVWTWNGIGKRAGAWALDRDAPEARKGFLLNHLIGELLPEKGDGRRWSNSDPVTGQAAWYDLRVRIEKAVPAEASEPRFPPVAAPGRPVQRPDELRYGQEWAT